jgi:hypothetical protein
LRLYVDLGNATAQATYEGLGMQRCHYAMYETGFVADAASLSPPPSASR